MKAFILYTEIADNEKAADCWLNALQQRRDDFNDLIKLDKNGFLVDSRPLASIERRYKRRHRSRSKSLDQIINSKNNNNEKLKQQNSIDLIDEGNNLERGRKTNETITTKTTLFKEQSKDKLIPISLLLETTTLAESIINSSPVTSPTIKLQNDEINNNNNEIKNSWWKWPSRLTNQTIIKNEINKNKKLSIESYNNDIIQLNENNKKKNDEQKWLINYWINEQQEKEKIKENNKMNLLPNEILFNENELELNSPTESSISSTNSLNKTKLENIVNNLNKNNDEGKENEIVILKQLINKQKEQILELNEKLEKSKKLLEENGNIGLAASEFIAKSRFLRSELERINEHRNESNKQIETFKNI
ncbi:hypothetical protein Mgra_00004083 [Meloidogyne graminicola]|uniref:Uncharacterized protein n=1 Tax=Meloidogyne graminicola TaxID=189291 RepID=A0A8S9ZT22_9BILA|nr:hypothetical protein Mgra_00004083 [Meloidogyne graminicola]